MSAGRLADALASGAPGNVRPLLVDFDRAALSTLSEDVVRERLRLVSSLR